MNFAKNVTKIRQEEDNKKNNSQKRDGQDQLVFQNKLKKKS